MKNIISQQIVQQGGIESYLRLQQYKTLLRFLTCGSVDDGKSTLIGRLLHDTKQIYDDQLSTLYDDSKRLGTQGKKLDFALLVDGLQDERMQGITIDVAYRYFSTKKRKFIIADTPGHEQYTRNMVTGASTSDLAVLLIDARKGVREQTRRHIFITTLLGIRYFVVAINKMDLVNYDKNVFEDIKQDYMNFINKLSMILHSDFVPLSALNGDNVIESSGNMTWYSGRTLLDILDNTIVMSCDNEDKPLRFPVQYINRPNSDFRGYSGSIASGKLYVGQKIKVLPSGIISTVARIVTFNGEKKESFVGEAITLVLTDDVDVSRGDLLIDANQTISIVQYAEVDVVWMIEKELIAGQIFDIKIAGKKTQARVEKLHYQVDISNFTQHLCKNLPLNGIGVVDLSFDAPMTLDKYSDNIVTGGIIFIDQLSNITVGAGMVRKPLSKFCNRYNNINTEFELALNALIRRYFPHWGINKLFKNY